MEVRSTPSVFTFNPKIIPYQYDVISDILNHDYNKGVHEILLSGSVGSAKSILAAHAVVRHCLTNSGARVIIGRRALPDIKKTMLNTIAEHLECEELIEDKDYQIRENTAEVFFRNGSEIIPYYWADKKFKRVRSINASAAWIEELTENDENDSKAFFELKARLGRLQIKERFLICCTNPDSPSHWAYKYFIEGSKQFKNRSVYYSKTRDNPFLEESYIKQLEQDLDPKEARRLIHGEWVEIDQDRVYHAYDSEHNFINSDYIVDLKHPVYINFDFNIGENKPMSSCAYQFINGTFHVFDEVIIHGARTQNVMDEWFDKGTIKNKLKIIIHGDASGDARDTRSILSDYDIIRKFLQNASIPHEMQVPRANPPVRTRHNRVNAYCLNELGQRRLYVYKNCKVTHDGMRLTALKKTGNYIEDDSKPYQHVTTALGYGIMFDTNLIGMTKVSSQRR